MTILWYVFEQALRSKRILRGAKSCIFTPKPTDHRSTTSMFKNKFLIEFNSVPVWPCLVSWTRTRANEERAKETRLRKKHWCQQKIYKKQKKHVILDCMLLCFSWLEGLSLSPSPSVFFPWSLFFYLVPITSNSSPWTHNKINSLCCKPLSLWK